MAPDSRQMAVGSRQRSEIRGQTTEDRRQQAEGSGQQTVKKLEVRGNETVKADI